MEYYYAEIRLHSDIGDVSLGFNIPKIGLNDEEIIQIGVDMGYIEQKEAENIIKITLHEEEALLLPKHPPRST